MRMLIQSHLAGGQIPAESSCEFSAEYGISVGLAGPAGRRGRPWAGGARLHAARSACGKACRLGRRAGALQSILPPPVRQGCTLRAREGVQVGSARWCTQQCLLPPPGLGLGAACSPRAHACTLHAPRVGKRACEGVQPAGFPQGSSAGARAPSPNPLPQSLRAPGEEGVAGGRVGHRRLSCGGSCLLGHLSRDRQGTEAVFRWGRERGLSG